MIYVRFGLDEIAVILAMITVAWGVNNYIVRADTIEELTPHVKDKTAYVNGMAIINKSASREILAASVLKNVPWYKTVATVVIESGGNPRAVSKTNAQGLMQIEPGTQKDLGVTDPFNPWQSLVGGLEYLTGRGCGHLDDWKDKRACYNAGPGSFEKYGRRLYLEEIDVVKNGKLIHDYYSETRLYVQAAEKEEERLLHKMKLGHA